MTREPPDSLLAGKVAVVTGGGGGIGRGITEAFATHGATVVIAEIDEARARETEAAVHAGGGAARAQVVDVRQRDAVAQLRAATLAEHEHVDVLVNNVGHYVLRGGKEFLETTEADWDALYEVNLKHVLRCTQAFLPSMAERGSGSIVNVSTVEAFRGIPRHSVYGAFKGALTQFTKSLAVEVGRHGVRVNAIAPDLTQSLQVRYDRWVPDDQQHLVPLWVPLGRFGTPDDIAGVAVFLASDLSSFVTGTTVHADGGSLAAAGWFRREDGDWTNRPARP